MLCRSVHVRGFTAGQKTVENQDWAAEPPGHRAAGPWRAVGRRPSGRRAVGPLGRGGPWATDRWAAGLLLAKPAQKSIFSKYQAQIFGLLCSVYTEQTDRHFFYLL